MGKIKTTSIREGDVILKSDIAEVSKSFEAIDHEINQENIREEGLDRRVFKDQPWVGDDSTSEVTSLRRIKLIRSSSSTSSWRYVTTSAGDLHGSTSTTHPSLFVYWNPEKDSDIIIRCSFFIDTKGSALGNKAEYYDDFWEFGLLIQKPGEESETFRLNVSPAVGGIWPYTRMGLSAPFQEYVEVGGETSDARGSWYEHSHVRESQMAQSVTLVYHGHSRKTDPSIPDFGKDDSHTWTKPGTGHIHLVYRHKHSKFGIQDIYMSGLSMSRQSYRR